MPFAPWVPVESPAEHRGSGRVSGTWIEVRLSVRTRRTDSRSSSVVRGGTVAQPEIAPGTEPMPVWAIDDGDVRGVSVAPLYKTAPIAALRDSCFYAYLALADALRDGRARERKLAEAALHKRLRAANA